MKPLEKQSKGFLLKEAENGNNEYKEQEKQKVYLSEKTKAKISLQELDLRIGLKQKFPEDLIQGNHPYLKEQLKLREGTLDLLRSKKITIARWKREGGVMSKSTPIGIYQNEKFLGELYWHSHDGESILLFLMNRGIL